MSEQERANFLKAAVARGPGKRQIKPSAAIFEEAPAAGAEDDEDDVDFSAGENSSEDSDQDQDDTSSDASTSSSSAEQEDEKEESEDEIQILEGDLMQCESYGVSKASGQLPSTSVGSKDSLVCSVCLNLKQSTKEAEIIQCDKCELAVHEACYMVDDVTDDQSVNSSSSTEPWFCEPCMFGLNLVPHCELCPNRLGAFKKADVGGGWVHLICALYSVGISFGDVEHLSAVSWQEIDYKAFGRKPCIACLDKLEARTGITLQCEAGLCKSFYHVTCAQRLGLLVDAQNENPFFGHPDRNGWMESNFMLCKKHNHSDTLRTRKEAYAKFVKQESARMISFYRPVLNSRQEFKRRRQLQSYHQRMKKIENVTVVLPSMHNKKTKMLHTSAQFLNAFAEKAELLGMDRHQFEDKFMTVRSQQLPNLPPAFSTSFVRYFEHREDVVVPEEEQHLIRAKDSKASALGEQKALEKSMKLMQEKIPKLHERHAAADALLNRLSQALYTLTGSHKHPAVSKASTQNKTKISKRSHTAQTSKKTKNSLTPTAELPVPDLEAVKPPIRRPNILSRSTPKRSPVKTPLPSLENPLKIEIPVNNKIGFSSPTGSSKSKKLSSRTSSMSPTAGNNWLVMSPANSFSSLLESIEMHKCYTCDKITDQHLLILCDTCKHHYHIGCLDPPLKRMPTHKKNCAFECSDCACPSTSENEPEEIKTKQEDEEDKDASVASRRKIRKRLAVFNSPSLELLDPAKSASKKQKNGEMKVSKRRLSAKRTAFNGHSSVPKSDLHKGSTSPVTNKKLRSSSSSHPSKLSSPASISILED